jgi:DNA-binding response OmpR family regulator
MKIATLFAKSALESSAAEALAGLGAEVVRHHDVLSLVDSLRRTDFDAAVIEDVEPALSNSLAMLQRHDSDHTPIIVTGAGGADAIFRALQKGADDYAILSEGSKALAHRVGAHVLLRTQRKYASVLKVGSCSLNAETKQLTSWGGATVLTGREFALAWALFENAGRIVTLIALSMQIWGKTSDISKRTIEQHIYKLRRKLAGGEAGGKGQLQIETIYGVGYRLSERSNDFLTHSVDICI